MEPISAGVFVAGLIAKALDSAEGDVVDGVIGLGRKALEGLRRRFAGDAEAEGALDSLVAAPDSPRRAKALADLLEARAEDSAELRDELAALVADAQGAGIQIGAIEQVAEGHGNVQVISQNSQVNIQTGTPPRTGD